MRDAPAPERVGGCDGVTSGPAPTQAEVLSAIALCRTRLLSSLLFVGMLAWASVLEIVLHPPIAVTVVDLAACAMVGAIAAISRRVTAGRWGHLLCSILWCVPVAASLFDQWAAPDPLAAVMVPLEMVAATVLLDTRCVVVLLSAVQLAWIALSLRAGAHDAALMISTGLTAQIFAIVTHVVSRHALLTQIATAHQLQVQLAERVQLEQQLLHAQRMDAVGTLAAGLAHDMNNVLGSITSFASLLDAEVQSPRGRADLEQIIAQSLRGAELTRGLLAFSRRGKYRKQAIRIDDVVHEVLPILARTLPRSIEIRDELAGGGLCVEGDPVQLGQVLINLSLNAAQAMDDHGTLTIGCDVVELDGDAARLGLAPGRHARYRVTDTGTGMDEATLRRAFEPFFTTKPAGKGTGLGLSVVWGIIQSHHGAIGIESAPGEGTTFTFHLPVAAGAAVACAAPVAIRSTRLQRVGTVLIADDEPAVLAGTARIIERMGLSALRASNGEELLDQYRRHAGSIDLVILDMGMPVMGGAECFDRLREVGEVPVLIATGYAADAEVQGMVARGAELIEKPYVSSDLIAAIARLVKADTAARSAS